MTIFDVILDDKPLAQYLDDPLIVTKGRLLAWAVILILCSCAIWHAIMRSA